MNELWWIALFYLIGLNIVTYFAFWIDKERSRQQGYRISENNLLLLAFLGGSPAALIARHRLRQKTRKQPFSSYLLCIPVIQIGFAVLLIGLSA